MADMSETPVGEEDVPETSTPEGYTQTDFAEAMAQDSPPQYTQEDFVNTLMEIQPEVSVDAPSTPEDPIVIEIGGSSEKPQEVQQVSQPVEKPVEQPVEQPQEEQKSYWNRERVVPTYNSSEESLAADPEFISAARRMAERMKGNAEFGLPPEGASDAELADWAIQRMGQFNWNLTTMVTDAFDITKWEPEDIEAFVYVMDSYESLPNFTWSGTGRLAKGVLSDPTTYVGIGVLGRLFGMTGKESGKTLLRQLVKKGVKEETAKKIVQRGLLLSGAAVEGGLYTGADDLLRQSVGVTSGRQEEIDYAQTAKAAGFGMLAGPGMLITGYAGIKGMRSMVDGFSNLRKAREKGDIVPEVVEETAEATTATVEGKLAAAIEDAPNNRVGDTPTTPEKPTNELDEAVDVERKFDDKLDEVVEGTENPVIKDATKPNKDGRVVSEGPNNTVVIEDGHKWIPNLTKLETTEQAVKLIFDTAQKKVGKLLKSDGRKGGVQTLAQAKKEAKAQAIKMAEASGRDTGQAGKLFDNLVTESEGDIKALKAIQARSLVVTEMVTEIASKLADMAKKNPEEFTNAEKAEFLQLKDVLDTLSVMDGLYSRNFARNLGSRRITRGTWEILDTLNKADDASGSGVTGMVNSLRRKADAANDEFVKLHEAVKSSRGNLKILRKNTKPSKVTQAMQKVVGFRTEAMISGLATEQAALFGNLINIIKYPVLKKIAGRFRGGEVGAQMRMEAGVLVSAYRMYANEARKLAIRAYKQGGGITDPAKTQSKIEGYETHKSDPSFIKKLTKFTLFGDLMSGFDEFTKALFTRSEAYAKAYTKILENEPKIKPEKARRLADDYVRKLIDKDTGQFKDMDLIQTARELSYMQDVNDTVVGRTVNQLANAAGGLGRLVAVPFVKAPLNIISEGLMFVPGTARITERQSRILSDFKEATRMVDELEAGAFKDISKEEADLIRRTYEQAAEAKAFLNARKAVGGALVMTTVGMASQGYINGNGPTEKQARKLWLKNHRPLSFKLPGMDEWVSYKAIEPFATVIALSADITHTAMRLSEEEMKTDVGTVTQEVMSSLMVLASDTFLNKSMLMGVDTLLEALQDDKAAERFIKSFASSFVPNFIKDIKPDEYSREHYTLANALAKKVPLLDEMVGKRYDDYGRPIESDDWLFGALAVSKTFKGSDPVSEVLYELRDKYDREGSLGSMSPNLGVGTRGTDFRKIVDYSDIGFGESVYSKFHSILGRTEINGETMYEALNKAIQHPSFEALSVGNDSQAPLAIKRISKIMRSYRDKAKQELYKVSPKYKEAVDNELMQKQQVQIQSFQNILNIGNQ
jgi:hypothetical protein